MSCAVPDGPGIFGWPEERLAGWWNAVSQQERAAYVDALDRFADRAHAAQSRGASSLVAVLLAACVALTESRSSGVLGVIAVLTSPGVAALLPIAYGLALRTTLLGASAHFMASAHFRRIQRTVTPTLASAELHAPMQLPDMVSAADLLAWAGPRAIHQDRRLRWAEFVVRRLAVVALLLAGPVVASAAAFARAPLWAALPSMVLGLLLVCTAARPLLVANEVAPEDMPRT